MQTVSRMLTVRRMFSLLHYRVILARKGPNVKDFFLPFSEYSAPGLGIVHSVQLWCRSADNWEFAGLFGQWCAVSMRYTALPPALVRGVVRVAHTGGTPLVNAGGKASIHPRTLTARQIPFYRFEALTRYTYSPTMVPGSPEKAERTSRRMPWSRAISTLRSWSTWAPLPMRPSIRS